MGGSVGSEIHFDDISEFLVNNAIKKIIWAIVMIIIMSINKRHNYNVAIKQGVETKRIPFSGDNTVLSGNGSEKEKMSGNGNI